MSIISTEKITKVFVKRTGYLSRENVVALDRVTVELNSKEIVGIVGASGSGKSTLAKTLVLMHKPDSGKVLYNGKPIDFKKSREISAYRKKVQMVFQDPYASLDPNHDVEWHIKRPLLLHRYSGNMDNRVDELLEMVTLHPAHYYRKKFPYQLSGGQRQRVYLARVLALEPEVVIADEPVSMLDMSVRIDILSLITKLRDTLGLSFFYITHDLNTVSYLTDRIYVIENGSVVEQGPTSQILANPRTDYTKSLIQAAPDPYKRIEPYGGTDTGSVVYGEQVLKVKELSAGYHTSDGFVDILSDLNFNVSRGEIFGIAGESGSGKSTVAQAVFSMLDYPGEITHGTVEVNGENIYNYSENKLRSSRGKRMSYVPQAAMNSLNPVRRIEDQFIDLFMAHNIDMEDYHRKFVDKLSLVRLNESVLRLFPYELSGGMRQRVVIAMALLLDPTLIIFDEPTTGLDVLVEYEILRDIKSIQRKLNLTIVFITHDLSILFEIADRIGVMYGGEFVEMGNVKELLASPHHPYTYLLIGSIPRIGIPKDKVMRIPGTSLDFRSPRTGCLFSDRCPFAAPECKVTHPDFVQAKDNPVHYYRCIRYPEWKEAAPMPIKS